HDRIKTGIHHGDTEGTEKTMKESLKTAIFSVFPLLRVLCVSVVNPSSWRADAKANAVRPGAARPLLGVAGRRHRPRPARPDRRRRRGRDPARQLPRGGGARRP